MCVLAFAWRADPRWPLVAIANRDEFHARPTAPLARWGNGVIAGRDLRSGGTWLGVGENRFVALTNLRSDTPPDPAAPSRGGLVSALLEGCATPETLRLDAYSPFSLACLSNDAAWLLTNRPEPERRLLEPGIHGLTNGPFDRPWPKLAGLKQTLADWLERGDGDPAPLFAALADERVPEGAYDEATALPPFIRRPVYGTRCSTVVTVDTAGRGRIVERSFDAGGKPIGDSAARFSWSR